MKLMVVVGARPNFMKAAPILRAVARHNGAARDENAHHEDAHDDDEEGKPERGSASAGIDCLLLHTGQHYDAKMSDAFFADLELPQPDIFLGVGSESHAAQTAEIMKRFEPALLSHRPDVVVVAGDVNSTLACALVAAKIGEGDGSSRPLIAHVEAGLRSFDRSMPEELNRILTDHLSDLLFVSEASGLRNLQNEGIRAERVFFVGNTMIDSLLAAQAKADRSRVLDRLGLRGSAAAKAEPYALLTLHRPANVDQREAFREILEGLRELAEDLPVIFPAHPRTRKQIADNGLRDYFAGAVLDGSGELAPKGILMLEPQGYLDFLCLMKQARLVVTDSGGIQEETTALGVPCVTVRENTERPVTVECGSNLLGGVGREGIRRAIQRQLQRTDRGAIPEFWDGRAAGRIVDILVKNQAARSSERSAGRGSPPGLRKGADA